jgi:hypothetical protein
MAHSAGGPLTRVGQNGTAARRLGLASRPWWPIWPEPAGAATRAHGMITAATAAAVAHPPAASSMAKAPVSYDAHAEQMVGGRGRPRWRGDGRRRFLVGAAA